LGWFVATTVVIAALQRAVDDTGTPVFAAKGGVYLELRLDLRARATTDLDGIGLHLPLTEAATTITAWVQQIDTA